jgi:hypothetical protein
MMYLMTSVSSCTMRRKSLSRDKKKTTTSAASLLPIPITITMLSAPSSQISHLGSSPAETKPIHRLDISGFRDDDVQEYCAWQQEQVRAPEQKVEYQKACDFMLKDGWTLELLRQDPDPKILIDGGVKRTRKPVWELHQRGPILSVSVRCVYHSQIHLRTRIATNGYAMYYASKGL